MIDIVTPDLYSAYAPELRAMHRLRYRVFKERLGWDVETRDGEERDRFDDLGPTYVLAFDPEDVVVGSWRLLPTTGPNMLRDVFPQLLDGRPMPCDRLVWECSRFSVDCGEGRSSCLASINRTTSEIFCGLVEYCLLQGIREVVTVYDVRIARILPRVACRPQWHSRPQRIGATSALVGSFEISPAVLEAIRSAGGITGSMLRNVERLATSAAA